MRWTLVSALLAACWLMVEAPTGACGTARAAAQEESAAILTPAEGQSVAGLVAIAGTAASPGFQRYEVDFGYEPNVTDTWFPIQEPVSSQQFGGTLAQWDTVGQGIADGVYVLRLRVFRQDGTFLEAFAHNILLQNGSPLGPPGQGAEPAAATPTATSVFVQLPPTSTPRPTLTPQPTDAPAAGQGEDPAQPLLDLPAFGSAFARGIGWTIGLFVLLGLYAALRPRLRPHLWRLIRRLVKAR
jgi:hypothetical protein